MTVTERERERGRDTEREAGSMHWEPDVGFNPGSLGSRPGPKAGAKPLRHPGIPSKHALKSLLIGIILLLSLYPVEYLVFRHFEIF